MSDVQVYYRLRKGEKYVRWDQCFGWTLTKHAHSATSWMFLDNVVRDAMSVRERCQWKTRIIRVTVRSKSR